MCSRVAIGVFVALATMLGVSPRTARAMPFGEVTCDRCVMDVAGAKLTVSGKIATMPLSVDVRGYTSTWAFGALALRDVVATARDHGSSIQACVAGKLGDSRLVACGLLPRDLERLKQLRAVDVTWRLAGTGGNGHGSGRLAWTDDHAFRIERGHVELELPAHAFGLATARSSIVADLAGALSPLDLVVNGRARVGALDAGPVHLTDVDLPVAVRARTEDGTVLFAPQGPLVGRAAGATIDLGARELQIAAPTLTLHGSRPFAAGLVGTEQVLTWSAITGLPVDLGAGSATVRVIEGGVHVERARFDALDADVSLDPFDVRSGSPTDANLHVRGLPLARVLHLLARDRIEGSGTLDADLALRRDETGLFVTRGTLHARAGGELHVKDIAWAEDLASVMGLAIHRRVATTLADFAYDRLALTVQPRGRDPESMLSLHGQGKHVPQELDIVVNVHGARRAARWLLTRVDRTE